MRLEEVLARKTVWTCETPGSVPEPVTVLRGGLHGKVEARDADGNVLLLDPAACRATRRELVVKAIEINDEMETKHNRLLAVAHQRLTVLRDLLRQPEPVTEDNEPALAGYDLGGEAGAGS